MRSLFFRVVGVASAVLLLPLFWASPAAAATEQATVEISGRGWGHGRGLGQYGAYGYATDHGWSSEQILDHFYTGTTAGTIPEGAAVDPGRIRVELSYNSGASTTVGLESGRVLMRGADGEDLGYISEGAVRVSREGSAFIVRFANSCAGPWTVLGGIEGHGSVRLISDGASSPGSRESMLHVCRSGTARTWYSGEVVAVAHNGRQRTVNVTTIEEYLRGVVPNESPPSWPAAALEAQAVAARSYAMAGDSRQQPYADTCETTRCQVFKGRFHQNSGGSAYATTDPRTDAAIAATAGVVRLSSPGHIARTEFSSSTGGHTAGGTFAAVKDVGDDTPANPNREWTKIVDVSALEARFGKGKLLELVPTARNGLGSDGGRVTEIEFRFENGTVTQTGWAARTTLGLKSDWFTVGPIKRGSSEQIENYVTALSITFLGAAPDTATLQSWTERAYTPHDRTLLATELVHSDQFAGVMLSDLYDKVFGRAPDSAGAAYWREVMRTGFRFDRIGANLYGSAEYFNSSGRTHVGFVTELYRDILGREPDDAGLSYWVGILDASPGKRVSVAAYFYRSLESRRDRTIRTYTHVLGFAPSESSIKWWSERLLSTDDLGQAVELATTERYFDLAQR
jgi:SpoIID/LytB domain protein